MIRVTYINREVRTGGSIEGIFDVVKGLLKDKIAISNYYYNALIGKMKNLRAVGDHVGDVNHITGDVSFLALGLKDKKNILTIHDFGHYEKLRKGAPLKFFLFHLFWFKWPLRYVRIVTVVSEFTKQKLVRYFNFPEKNIRVIYNPIKPIFEFYKKQRTDRPVILQIGTGPHKNLNNLVEAVRGMNVHLDIVGMPDAQCLEKLSCYKISYQIFNKLSDKEVYERYKTCSILFFASFHEGFGMPIIEAQAVGRPVITSNIDAMLEVARDTAVLVDPTKADEIKNAIVKLVSDERYYDEVVSRGSRNTERFQNAAIANEYYKVYKELAEQIN